MIALLLAVLLIGGWLGVGAVGGPVFGTISTVENDDQASYLPASAEATKVQNLQASFYGGDTVPATVLFVRDGGITGADRSAVTGMARDLGDVAGVREVSPPIPSEDGRALQLIVSVDEGADGTTVVGHMRGVLTDGHIAGLRGWVTGPVALGADFGAGFSGLDGVLLLVALAAVFVILLIVYRSLLLPIAVLAVSSFALTGSILIVYLMAKADWITVTGQSRGILAILAIGAATDYALLLVARYREALLHEPSPLVALWSAWRRTIAPIGASAATVILAVLCLGFSDLNSNKGLGPVAAIAIAFAFLAATTALPAILALLGRAAFWPLVPRVLPVDAPAKRSRTWAAVGRLVDRRPRTVWVVTALVLGALATGVFGLQAAGVPQSDLLLTASQSVAGEKELAKHYDAGSGTPAVIVAPEGCGPTCWRPRRACGTSRRRPCSPARAGARAASRRSSTAGCSSRRRSRSRRTPPRRSAPSRRCDPSSGRSIRTCSSAAARRSTSTPTRRRSATCGW
ncbi:hypothetical protein GCM10025881_23560 [Pseudolysinimonas kribbensis]|uniref:Membrane transport protein MMPL domain-containing protein n=1 Tax=Pseudolysinimonas kribbensis TaxID=433641 RepID=A0ABQ6K4I5_9MICO|nr:hypothetical protein GCM10025881_23560 [Pseudolysinimonas kribbensis]